jgi:hypothetical protein
MVEIELVSLAEISIVLTTLLVIVSVPIVASVELRDVIVDGASVSLTFSVTIKHRQTYEMISFDFV